MDPVCLKCREELRRQGIMQPIELRAARAILGLRGGHGGKLSQAAFAELLGISPRALRNYEKGLRRIPAPVAKEARRLRREAATRERSSEK